MTRITYIFLLICLLALPGRLSSQDCWELIWAEEFDYTGFPDPSIWSFEVGTGSNGWGNNELQYYRANNQANSWVEDGTLKITAIQESFGNRQYTSARIITRDKFSVQYGKIEARMKLPKGQGIWPAFWGLGDNYGSVGWPACGEIDIMEMIGGDGDRDNTIHGTLHWSHNNSHASHGGKYTLPSGIFADDFHVISIIWNPQTIRWYINDQQFFIMNIAPLSAFHQKFFLILNLAVGGNWPGSPNQSTEFPQTFEIDYIRVYKTQADVTKIEILGDDVFPEYVAEKKFSLPFSPDWTYEWIVPEDAVIVEGQGTESITVIWGCTEGEVQCNVTGVCGDYIFKKEVSLKTTIYSPMFIRENEEGVLFYVDSMAQTTFEWIVPDDAVIVRGQGTDSIWVNWGSTFNDIILITESPCGKNEHSQKVIKAGQYPYPDIYTPHTIPGVIEAVHFDYGGPGVAYHDTSSGNQGPGPRQDTDVDTEYNDGGSPNVGWITNGEWLEYTIKVDEAGFYKVDMRVATNNTSGGPFAVYFNGEQRLNNIRIQSTGSWSTFKPENVGVVYLTEADTLMRLHFYTGGFNLGKITFTPTTDPNTSATNYSWLQGVEVFPVPSQQFIHVSSDEQLVSVEIIDLKGKVLRRIDDNINKQNIKIDISELPEGVYLVKLKTQKHGLGYRRIVKIR